MPVLVRGGALAAAAVIREGGRRSRDRAGHARHAPNDIVDVGRGLILRIGDRQRLPSRIVRDRRYLAGVVGGRLRLVKGGEASVGRQHVVGAIPSLPQLREARPVSVGVCRLTPNGSVLISGDPCGL